MLIKGEQLPLPFDTDEEEITLEELEETLQRMLDVIAKYDGDITVEEPCE